VDVDAPGRVVVGGDMFLDSIGGKVASYRFIDL
jgi:hypothetical protein